MKIHITETYLLARKAGWCNCTGLSLHPLKTQIDGGGGSRGRTVITLTPIQTG